MSPLDSSQKQIYDALVILITTLNLKGRLSKEEMYCLLSILDFRFMGKEDYGLISSLTGWNDHTNDPEVSAIIKATLLTLDYNNLNAEKANIDTINELLRYNKELMDG
jgi:hypothetical protein